MKSGRYLIIRILVSRLETGPWDRIRFFPDGLKTRAQAVDFNKVKSKIEQVLKELVYKKKDFGKTYSLELALNYFDDHGWEAFSIIREIEKEDYIIWVVSFKKKN